jgi:hypothetical protein
MVERQSILQCGLDLNPVGTTCVGTGSRLRQVRCHGEKGRHHNMPSGVAVWCRIGGQLRKWKRRAKEPGFLSKLAVSGVLKALARTDEPAWECEHTPEWIRASPYKQDVQPIHADREDDEISGKIWPNTRSTWTLDREQFDEAMRVEH